MSVSAKPRIVPNKPIPPDRPAAAFVEMWVTGIGPDGRERRQWIAEAIDGAWRYQGACYDTDSNVFFPTHETGKESTTARHMCMGCEVALACLTFALISNQQVGIWGAENPDGRRRLRKKLRLG